MSTLESLDYRACLQAMQRCRLTFSPSEAHAIAAGLLTGGVTDVDRHWADAMYADLDSDDALAQECRDCLEQLYRATVEQVQNLEFGLQLFLPPAAEPGYNVSMALRDWAQGFLYGFGLVGDQAAQAGLSAEGQEALHDFYEIGQLEVPDGALSEEEEQAVAEIEEYLRVAAMLLYEDMHAPQATTEGSNEVH